MAKLIVLLEKDFKDTLRNHSISRSISLPHFERNINKVGGKPLTSNSTEIPSKNNDVVEILVEDIIDIDSDDDDGGAIYNEVKIEKKTKCSNYKKKQIQLYQSKAKEFNKASEQEQENSLNHESLDNENCKKSTQKKLSRTKLKDKKIKTAESWSKSDPFMDDSDNDPGSELDPFMDDSDNDPDFELSDSERNKGKTVVAKIKKRTNNKKKDNRKGDRSLDEHSENEELLDEDSSDKSDNMDDGDSNRRIRRELLANALSYICTICAVQVKTFAEKEAHRKRHNLRYLMYKTIFRCPVCLAEFYNSHHFKEHYQGRHSKGEGLFGWNKCTECPFKTASKQSLKKHLISHEKKWAFQCEYCSFSHDHQGFLTHHLRLHNKIPTGVLSCKECPYETKHSSSFIKHKQLYHTPDEEKKWHQCKECPYKTVEIVNLRRHGKCHKYTEGYECPHCTYRSPFASVIKVHIKLHYRKGEQVPGYDPKRQTPLHSCPKCSYTTMTKAHLDRHLTSHQTFLDRRLNCAECPYFCKDKYDLVSHIKCHNGEGALKCPWCSYTHWSKPSLTRHKNLHDEEPEVTVTTKGRSKGGARCPVCNKLFLRPCYLKSHMTKHQTLDQIENPFMCGHCPYRSKRKDNGFINHVLCHLNKDGIKCDFCSFRHARQNVMTTHMRMHTQVTI